MNAAVVVTRVFTTERIQFQTIDEAAAYAWHGSLTPCYVRVLWKGQMVATKPGGQGRLDWLVDKSQCR